jgi:type VI secretion system protein ImpH
MVVQFMGICCAISVLPAPYTEHLLALMKDKNFAMAKFFDVFNHRLISLFYRGWEKYRFFIGFERGVADPVSPRLMDLLGLGVPGLAEGLGIAEIACLNYFGLLGRHTRPAESLRRILEDYFDVPVAIHQFAGAWRTLPMENRTSLTGFGGASEILGMGVVAGDEVLDQHGRIRIALGPMRFERYLQFLPGRDASRELQSWFRFYANGNYEAEVQLILDRRDAPDCDLGNQGRDRPQLGYVSWLKTKPLGRDPADATYLIQ